ncbi:hypothetical protein ID866_11713, partial [Astraeus odoratus]
MRAELIQGGNTYIEPNTLISISLCGHLHAPYPSPSMLLTFGVHPEQLDLTVYSNSHLYPGDPNDPDGDDNDDDNASGPSVEDNPILTLTHAIILLSHTTRCRPEDSGAVHTKVYAWKVSFALSFLKGIALAWFKPDLLDTIPGTEPTWADDYSEFIIELTTNFGPHDPVSNAEHQLNNLSMKDSSQINKYIVEFNHLTTQVRGYGEGALHHIFYNGLPDCIKDKIARIGKPPSLIDLCTMAQGINMHYWECKSEIACQAKTNPQSSSSKQSSSGGSSSKQSNTSSEVCLNVSTLSDPDSLKPVVYIPNYNVSDVITLLDSGSSHC